MLQEGGDERGGEVVSQRRVMNRWHTFWLAALLKRWFARWAPLRSEN